jgi:hypothetical protein
MEDFWRVQRREYSATHMLRAGGLVKLFVCQFRKMIATKEIYSL